LLAQTVERAVEFRNEDRAFRNITNAARTAFEITDSFSNRIVLPLRARAIMPLIWCGPDLEIGNVFQAADAPKTITNDFFLRLELRFVTQLLKVATATAAKVRARRLNAGFGRRNYFFYRGKDHAPLHAVDANADKIAGGSQSDHHGAVICMSETEAAR